MSRSRGFWRRCPLSISAAAEPNGLTFSTLRLTPRSLGDLRAEGRVQGGQERPQLALAKCSLSREEQQSWAEPLGGPYVGSSASRIHASTLKRPGPFATTLGLLHTAMQCPTARIKGFLGSSSVLPATLSHDLTSLPWCLQLQAQEWRCSEEVKAMLWNKNMKFCTNLV